MHFTTGTCILSRLLQWSGNGIISQMLYQYNKEPDARSGSETGVGSATKENWSLTSLFP